MATDSDYEHMRDVINKDAFVTGLVQRASPALARRAGCQPGDLVGCAVFSLAVDAGVNPEAIYAERFLAYAAVERKYGHQVVQALHITNDMFTTRPSRLRALNLLIDRFKRGVFLPVSRRDLAEHRL